MKNRDSVDEKRNNPIVYHRYKAYSMHYLLY